MRLSNIILSRYITTSSVLGCVVRHRG